MSNTAQQQTDTTYGPGLIANAHIDAGKYDEMYAASVADPDTFWAEQAGRIDWIKPIL